MAIPRMRTLHGDTCGSAHCVVAVMLSRSAACMDVHCISGLHGCRWAFAALWDIAVDKPAAVSNRHIGRRRANGIGNPCDPVDMANTV